MAARVNVKTGIGTATDSHLVEGDPDALRELVNDALQTGDKFVTFTTAGGKKVSLIAERIESIWEE